MKQFLYTFGLLLSGICAGYAQVFPVTTLQDNGDINKRINFAYLAEGYTSGELGTFITDATAMNNNVFSQVPFSNYVNFFNAYAVEVPSAQSGTDHPGTATDVTEPSHPTQSVNTYFNSTFDYFDIHRLLVATNSGAIANVLASNVPQFDQGFIVINSPYYGGAGGQYATSSTHPSGAEVAIHEIGHSFGNLADEYYAGDFYASERFNMTQETNPALVKWDEWYGDNGVGIYQHCCSGNSASWYRPHQDCKMRSLGASFCAVCTQRIIDVIYSLASPIDSYTPTALTQTSTGMPMNFDLDVIYPVPNTLTIEWLLNGNVFATNTESVSVNPSDLNAGTNTLVASVVDETSMSRSYLPDSGYEFTVTWTINSVAPTTLDICMLLEGCYNPSTGLMRNTLETINLLSATQPYNVSPWNYNGGETLSSSSNVDWVLVSFRTGIDAESEIARTAGLLQQDGCVYFPNEDIFPSGLSVPVYIVVEHRNHLVAMTPQPVSVVGNTLTYDFRIANGYAAGGGFGQKQLPSGEWCLYAGDITSGSLSYDINGADKGTWLMSNGLFNSYFPADLDMNGDVNGGDKAVWLDNNGVFSSVPY